MQEPLDPPHEKQLDKRVILYWYMPYLLASLIVFIIISYLITANVIPYVDLPVPIIFILVLLFFLFNLAVLVYYRIHYNHYTYAFEPYGIVVRYGILNRTRKVMHYELITNINSKRDVLERVLGICTISIETAAGQQGGETTIQGIGIAERDHFISGAMESISRIKNNNKRDNKEDQKVDTQPEDHAQKTHDTLNTAIQEIASLKERIDSITARLTRLEEQEEKRLRHDLFTKLHESYSEKDDQNNQPVSSAAEGSEDESKKGFYLTQEKPREKLSAPDLRSQRAAKIAPVLIMPNKRKKKASSNRRSTSKPSKKVKDKKRRHKKR